MRKGKGYKYKWLPAVSMIMVLGLSACQQSPDASIVVHKDLDNMIDQAQNVENGSANVAEAAGNYETYQTTLQDENLGVTINVDARVDIPEVDQISVFRVAQTPITQELLDRVKEELVQGETLYDGAVLDSVLTKGDIESYIQNARDYYSKIEDGSIYVEDKAKELEDIQRSIDQYQEGYETAPDSIHEIIGSYPSDGQIHSVKQLYDAEPNSDFYSWEYGMNPEGEVYYGVSDGQNGQWTSLFVQNNLERGNCLRFRTCKSGVEGVTYAVSCATDLEAANKGMEVVWMSPSIWKAEEETIPAYIKREYSGPAELVRTADADVTISMEEAVQMADDFLGRIGIEGYQYYNGGLYYEILELQTEENLDGRGYRKEYILSFMRNIEGVFMTYDNTIKEIYETNGEDFRKRDWPQETIEFRINDDGIIGFDYNAPLEVVETVVDQSNLKSFDEIRSTFETMATIVNADPQMDLYEKREMGLVDIEIDSVVLGYALVSEPDSFDTGLLVPVWDFKGVHTWYGGDQSTYHSVMTINAIDGTVIDRSLGY